MIRIDLVDADVRVLTIVQILPPWKDNFRLKDFCGLIGYDSEIRILIFRFTELQKLQANCAMFRKCTCVSGRCLANLQPFLQVCIAIILIPLQWLRQWIISCMLLSHFWWDHYEQLWNIQGFDMLRVKFMEKKGLELIEWTYDLGFEIQVPKFNWYWYIIFWAKLEHWPCAQQVVTPWNDETDINISNSFT